MQLKSPLAATVLGGLVLGVTLRLATPMDPLPAPEPAWRKSGAAMIEPSFSAQTYEAQASANGYNYPPGGPQVYAAGFVPHPPEETLAYAREATRTSYDALPRYRETPLDPPASAIEEIDFAGDDESSDTETIVLPAEESEPGELPGDD